MFHVEKSLDNIDPLVKQVMDGTKKSTSNCFQYWKKDILAELDVYIS